MAKVLDLHIHSVFSIDSPVQPEEYIIHLLELRRKYRIDGLVFCEHRRFVWDLDYQALGEKYGVLVFAGVEAETRWGHILVYCPDLNWMSRVDFSQKFDEFYNKIGEINFEVWIGVKDFYLRSSQNSKS